LEDAVSDSVVPEDWPVERGVPVLLVELAAVSETGVLLSVELLGISVLDVFEGGGAVVI
jgi:hypothetical protein